jgi:DNA-binding response OmpR family regulator
MERILVVDDEMDICEILKFNLENSGYAVDVANSGKEALEMPIAEYSLLLLDVMMDDMSGFALTTRIRQDAALARIPIIFITAKTSENDVLTGFNVGADDYICKPFRINEVLARVKAVLRRSSATQLPQHSAGIISFGKLELNTETKRAYIDG